MFLAKKKQSAEWMDHKLSNNISSSVNNEYSYLFFWTQTQTPFITHSSMHVFIKKFGGSVYKNAMHIWVFKNFSLIKEVESEKIPFLFHCSTQVLQ